MLGNEGLDDDENLLLLVAGQFAHRFKDPTRLSERAGSALSRFVHAQEIIASDSSDGGQSPAIWTEAPPTRLALWHEHFLEFLRVRNYPKAPSKDAGTRGWLSRAEFYRQDATKGHDQSRSHAPAGLNVGSKQC